MPPRFALLVVLLLSPALLRCGTAGAAETFSLPDDPAGRTLLVAVDVTGEGTFRFQPPAGQTEPKVLPVTVAAAYRYAERRLPAAGRDEAAYRALRRYRQAGSRITVGSQQTAPALRPERRTVVAAASRRGVTILGPDGPLTATEVELLPYPGDSLLLPALLPAAPVAVGESWTPPDWVAATLAGVDEAFSLKLACRLVSVRDGKARIDFEGTVSGAVKGASAETSLSGTLTYDLAGAYIAAAKVTQTEKRTIGPLSPGMDLTLTASLRRAAAPAADAVSDADAAAVPLAPPAAWRKFEYAAPWGATVEYAPEWQLFHQNGQVLVLRLLDRGRLVAQANITPVAPGPGGRPVTAETFQGDIRQTLGERLSRIAAAEELGTADGLTLSRVTAEGEVGEGKRLWRYYLVTDPDGRQAACVVTVEPQNLEELADRDLALVMGLRFRSPDAPTPALTDPAAR